MRIHLNNTISYRENNLAVLMAAPLNKTNTNTQLEELTMTTTTNNTTTTMEGSTMNTTTNTITTEATTILENIKAGTSTTAQAVKGFDIKGMFASAWKAIKEYDYMGTAKKAWDKTVDMSMAFDAWLSGTKTGRTVAYTVKATSYLFVAGLFTHSVAAAILGGAALLTTADYLFSSKDVRPTFMGLVKAYTKNVAIMTGMSAVAWLVFPYVVSALTWAYYTAVAGVLLPLYSVFL